VSHRQSFRLDYDSVVHLLVYVYRAMVVLGSYV
jgi:hypothetical protein